MSGPAPTTRDPGHRREPGAARGSDGDGRAEEPRPLRERLRRLAVALGLLALLVSVFYGGDFLDVRERLLGLPTPQAPAGGRAADDAAPPDDATGPDRGTLVRSNPWWQHVRTREGGAGTTSQVVTIDQHALQWRVEWSCTAGRLAVATPGERLVSAECPGEGTAYGIGDGDVELRVEAGGPWSLVVDQQVDVPLEEPPLEAMTAPGAERLATGEFYDIDQTGRGRVEVHRLPDGSTALRLEGFFVTPDVDLELRLSPLEEPTTTGEYLGAPSVLVHPLTVTAGSFNVTVPADVDPTDYGSVVVWCPPIQSAYAAASLQTPR